MILAIAFSVILLGGALQALFGIVKLGTLIKFAPQPVMAGFQNAAALLLFLVQLGNVCGFDHTVPFMKVPALLGFDKAAQRTPRRDHLRGDVERAQVRAESSADPRRHRGRLRALLSRPIRRPRRSSRPRHRQRSARAHGADRSSPISMDLKRSGDLLALMPTIFGGALALAIIASIDALLCTKLVMAPGEPRRDGDRLLRRLGIAQRRGRVLRRHHRRHQYRRQHRQSDVRRAFAAVGPDQRRGDAGRRASFLFRWLGDIPRAALSAVIMVIAVQHFDLWSLRLMSRVRGAPRSMRISTAVDLLVVIVVAIVSITLNIVLAVFVGVAIAAMLFVFHMSRSVVRRSYRCDASRSRKSRTAPERKFLERAGEAILVMELQGALFFGTGETLASAIERPCGQVTTWVILDLRRLTEVDSTGAHVLLELKADLAWRNVKLWLAAADKTVAKERMEEFGARASFGRTEIFPDIDRAIQQAEDELLRVEGHMGAAAMELDDVGLFAGFARQDLQALKSYMTRKSYARAPGGIPRR